MSFAVALLLASLRVLSPERSLTAPVLGENRDCTNPDARPMIASSGAITFAAWSDYRSGPVSHLFASRLEVGLGSDIPIATTTGDSPYLDGIVWDGERFLVVWLSSSGTMVSELRTDGTLATATNVSPEAGSPGDIAPRRDGGVMIIGDNKVISVSRDLQHVETHRLSLTPDPSMHQNFFGDYPHLAAVEDGWVVIWFRSDPPDLSRLPLLSLDAMAQRLDNDGNPIGQPVTLGACYDVGRYPTGSTSATSRGQDALIAYYDAGQIHVFRVTESTISPFITDVTGSSHTMLATPDGGLIIADGTNAELHRFDANGRPVDRIQLDGLTNIVLANTDHGVVGVGKKQGSVRYFEYGGSGSSPVSLVPKLQTAARLATDGVNTLVLWREQQELAAQIADSTALPVHVDDSASESALTFDGTSYNAIWTSWDSSNVGHLRTQRLDRNGALLDQTIEISGGGLTTAISAAGPFAAWIDHGKVYWMSFDEQSVKGGERQAWNIDTAWDGSSAMFAFVDNGYPEPALWSMVPGGVPVRIDSVANTFPRDVAIAGDGTRWFVVYNGTGRSDRSNRASVTGLYGRYLNKDGSPSGPANRHLKRGDGDVAARRMGRRGLRRHVGGVAQCLCRDRARRNAIVVGDAARRAQLRPGRNPRRCNSRV